jgi:hypothetical protein
MRARARTLSPRRWRAGSCSAESRNRGIETVAADVTLCDVDPEHRPSNLVSARQLALIKQEMDACRERDLEEILADLLWTAWPTVWSQDQ